MPSPYNYLDFYLPDEFIAEYENKPVPWGYQDAAGNSLGEITFLRSYSRLVDGHKERWFETCRRVTEGTYHEQRKWCKNNRLPWNWKKATASAKEFYDRMFNMKWLPPGRGLWAMGTEHVHVEGNSAALQNCAYISTSEMTKDHPELPFAFMMEASMLGVGVGFDTRAANKFKIYTPQAGSFIFVVPDSREGWTEALSHILRAYLIPNQTRPRFDFTLIRPEGAPIKRFGGTAPGPQPLIKLIAQIEKLLDSHASEMLSTALITDLMNMIGVCVVSGNIRRSAELALGSADDEQFLDLKNYEKNPYRMEWGWMSNNSIDAKAGAINYDNFVGNILANGEPGFVYTDLMRSHGRLIDPANNKDQRAKGTNPCAEQTLESWECVTGDTRLQTRTGLFKIKDLIGQYIEIWNGSRWSEVGPFATGKKEVYRVHLSDGSYLDASENHEWSARKNKTFKKYRTTELEPGLKLPEFEIAHAGGVRQERAYEWGWMIGDGYLDRHSDKYEYPTLMVHKDNQAALQHLSGRLLPLNQGFYRIRTDAVSVAQTKELRDHNAGIPHAVFGWDTGSLRDFFGGWIDTDGSLIRQANTDNYVLYGSEQQLRDAQLLLRRIGVNHASIHECSPTGKETNKGVRSYALWRLNIPSFEADAIKTKIKRARRFGTRLRVNNRHPLSFIDAARKQKIENVEYLGEVETFCFTERERHMGVFNNVLTHQCCTLVETFPTNCKDMADYMRTLKYAYLYAKTVTLIPTHWPETNAVMQRNRRIGLSMSGMAQFVESTARNELRTWMDLGYNEVQKWDRIYSEWLGVRESIKTTSVKPSGSVSLLAGVTPGVHWPVETQYIRRIIFSKTSPMIEVFRAAGYNVVPSVYNPDADMIVEFPIRGVPVRPEREVSVFEKADLAALAQLYWADNQVSCTITFDREKEGQYIPVLLRMFEGRLKSISFLPMDKTAYQQMPYEAIDDLVFEEMSAKLKPVDWSKAYFDNKIEAEGEKYCTTDVCEIRPAGK